MSHQQHPLPAPGTRGGPLTADCARCFGLCCVAPAFVASSDFAVDKKAGEACRHLQVDFRCGIHSRLAQQGFTGCSVFDCFGAGQQVSHVTFGGRDWRRAPDTAPTMFAVFAVMRQLHELLWYLTEALALNRAAAVHPALRTAVTETTALTRGTPEQLAACDVAAHRQRVNPLLQQASELARSAVPGPRPDHRGADLIGRNLRRADLRGANLRGAYLIRADLRGADLTGADVTGADLRGADLRGAALAGTLFLTQAQLDAARGDRATTVPAALLHPPRWAAAGPAGRPAPGPRS